MDKARRKSRLLPSIQSDLIRQLVAGVPARTAAELTGVNCNSAILFFHKLRKVIAGRLAEEVPFLDGEVEVDESYSGSARKVHTAFASENHSCLPVQFFQSILSGNKTRPPTFMRDRYHLPELNSTDTQYLILKA